MKILHNAEYIKRIYSELLLAAIEKHKLFNIEIYFFVSTYCHRIDCNMFILNSLATSVSYQQYQLNMDLICHAIEKKTIKIKKKNGRGTR